MKKLCILLCLLLLLTACSGPAPAPESTDRVNYTDALGRSLSIEKYPLRTAALLGSFADIWTLAGGTLCAASEDAWEDFGLESDTAVNIGGAHSPSLELLLSADPQLVLASASTAGNVDFLAPLEAAGITVVYFDIDHFDDYLQMLELCTELTGRKDLYEQNGLALCSRIEAVKAEYEQLALEEAKRKILLIRVSASTLKAKGSSGTILGEMLADFGCINIADSETQLLEELSLEAVLRQEPYRIFVVTMGSDTAAAMDSLEQLIAQSPAWSSLSAVQEGRLHFMDKSLFNLKPNSRWAEAYEVLYETLTEE